MPGADCTRHGWGTSYVFGEDGGHMERFRKVDTRAKNCCPDVSGLGPERGPLAFMETRMDCPFLTHILCTRSMLLTASSCPLPR